MTDYPLQENREVKVIECIHVTVVRGAGTASDIAREVEQWWTFDGRLIAEHDPCATKDER